MGKKRKAQTYHPQINREPAKRVKNDYSNDKFPFKKTKPEETAVEPKEKKTIDKILGNDKCDVTIIDVESGKQEFNDSLDINKNSLSFNFNSADDFNPDADSMNVAAKCWDWLLNPIGLDHFKKDIQGKKVLVV